MEYSASIISGETKAPIPETQRSRERGERMGEWEAEEGEGGRREEGEAKEGEEERREGGERGGIGGNGEGTRGKGRRKGRERDG